MVTSFTWYSVSPLTGITFSFTCIWVPSFLDQFPSYLADSSLFLLLNILIFPTSNIWRALKLSSNLLSFLPLLAGWSHLVPWFYRMWINWCSYMYNSTPDQIYIYKSMFYIYMTSLVAQMVKRLPTMQETRVQSLGREDPWRRIWQPTPVLLPGKSHGWRCMVGYSPWGCKESDMTEWLHFHYINL